MSRINAASDVIVLASMSDSLTTPNVIEKTARIKVIKNVLSVIILFKMAFIKLTSFEANGFCK